MVSMVSAKMRVELETVILPTSVERRHKEGQSWAIEKDLEASKVFSTTRDAWLKYPLEDINQMFLRKFVTLRTDNAHILCGGKEQTRVETLSRMTFSNNLKAYESEGTNSELEQLILFSRGVNTRLAHSVLLLAQHTVENLSDDVIYFLLCLPTKARRFPEEILKGSWTCQKKNEVGLTSQGGALGVFQLPQERTHCKGVHGTHESKQQEQGAY
ncbi:hypothetical protein Tco_1504619 [Tanacetum coccineum]